MKSRSALPYCALGIAPLDALRFFLIIRRPPRSTVFSLTTLIRSGAAPPHDIPVTVYVDRSDPTDALVSGPRSEEHTSELQSRKDLVSRLLHGKKHGTTAATMNKQYLIYAVCVPTNGPLCYDRVTA